jgi:hypothetical protein
MRTRIWAALLAVAATTLAACDSSSLTPTVPTAPSTTSGSIVQPGHYWGGFRYFYNPFGLAELRGLYTEQLAEFAPNADVVINVDSMGHWFFQDATTGCTGNGAFAPVADGTSVFTVELTIAGCDATHATLNTEFAGLATYEPAVPWEYANFGPRMWLSTRAGSAAPAAPTGFAADY